MKKITLLFFGILGLMLVSVNTARACHGSALIGLIVTSSPSGINIDASSDAQTCGCGPYYMEVEMSLGNSFTGTAPNYTSSAWGTFPWYHSLLNIPNYGPPNWVDNCVIEPYTTIFIPYSSLCAGSTVWLRVREIPVFGTPGPWTNGGSYVVPGSPSNPTVSISSSNAFGYCLGDSTQLTATGLSCSGSYSYSWFPTVGLTNPNSAVTYASPTTTTTYTVTFTDLVLNQSATSTVTVNVFNPPTITFQNMIESTCNGSTGIVDGIPVGNMPFTFQWMPSGQLTQQASNLSSGNQTLTVVDGNGCVTTSVVMIGDSCDFVWPGDANDDAVANNFDILDIGIANGATGTTRPGASLTWIGQPSPTWGQTLASGTDYKFVDCNGDGAINMIDTNAVNLNYGFTHNNRWGAPVYDASVPDLALVMSQDSILPLTPGTASLNLGTAALNATNIYGVACTIHFDPTQINGSSIGISPMNSWFGTPSTDLIGFDYVPGSGQLDLALTRLDHANRTGAGAIAMLHFVTTNALTGSGNTVNVPFTITDVRVLSANGAAVLVNPINDTLSVYDPGPLGVANTTVRPELTVLPNPNAGQFTLSFESPRSSDYQLEVVNGLGQVVYTETLQGVQGSVRKDLDLGAVSGLYLVRVTGADGMWVGRVICR